MLKRHVVGLIDEKTGRPLPGADVAISSEEEAAIRAEWSADDQRPRAPLVSTEERLARLEAAVERSA
jgi:hypothetical protein